MKNNMLKYSFLIVAGWFFFTACDDTIEPKYSEDFTHSNRTEAYYKNLRDYKKSDHAVAFGWFGNWSGVGASLGNCMAGLPDSVDFVSMWGGWKNPTKEQLDDLRFVQKVKGTKALVCFVLLEVGDQITPEEYAVSREKRHEYWGWVDGDEEKIRESIVRYANALCDIIDKYDYDGFDLDWEPSYAQPFDTNKEMASNGRITLLLETMAKRIGATSGTDKLLVVDGEPEHSEIAPELGKSINYFISQAYACAGPSNLDYRLQKVVDHYKDVLTAQECAAKMIFCENFESYSADGGVSYTTADGRSVRSVEGMALYNPKFDGAYTRKGGVGTFHMEYEYEISGKNESYPYLRKAIQIMNPAVK